MSSAENSKACPEAQAGGRDAGGLGYIDPASLQVSEARYIDLPLQVSPPRTAASAHQIDSGMIAASDIAGMLEQDIGSEGRIQALWTIFTSMTLSTTGICFVIDSQALIRRLLSTSGETRTDQMLTTADDEDIPLLTVDLPIAIKRRGIEMKIVVDSPHAASQTKPHRSDCSGTSLSQSAYRWIDVVDRRSHGRQSGAN